MSEQTAPTNRISRATLPAAAMAAAVAALLALAPARVGAQNLPADDGLRFQRAAAPKSAEMLAQKPGGPTERIEVQSTDDHIDYVVKTYVLKNANANEAYQFIVNAVRLENGRVDRFAPGSVVTLEENGVKTEYSGESILIVTVPDWMIPYLDETIKTLDVKGLAAAAWGDGTAFLRPKHRKPSELADLIANSVASGLQIFQADDSRNVLYVEDLPSWFPYVIDGFKAFDVPPDQLDARVRIYEIAESQGRDVGIDWYNWKKSIRDGGLDIHWDNSGNPSSYQLDLQSLSADLSFNPLLATEFLNYLVERGHANVITDTRVTLVNGQEGVVRSVQRVPYVVRGALNGEVADSPLRDAASFEIKEYIEGVTVTIAPTIGTETIELKIAAAVSSHVGYTPNQSVPIVAESSVESDLVLEGGKPAVFGGLTRTTTVEERSGIPGLKDVPYVKYLFSREVKREHKSSIIVTIRPDRTKPGDAPTAEPGVALGEALPR